MADWFAKLMHRRQARSSRAIQGPASFTHARVSPDEASRDPRYDTLVRLLREREAESREAREKRQRWYRQSLADEETGASGDASSVFPARLQRFRTRVPCRVTPEARAMLDQLGEWFPDGIVSFPRAADGRQAVMLTDIDGSEPRQIGWVEQCVQTDPDRCNVRHQGLTVEIDADAMLALRFRYPRTATHVSSRRETASASVEFAEIRSALDPRPADRGAPPRHVWLTRPELETIEALQSRDYEAFYVRLKLEVQAGIWSALSALLSTLPASRWHEGSCYTVVREPDAASRRIRQRTLDDSGRPVDIGADRIYDAAPATDILLLYLDRDVLADFADIYFTLQSLGSADAYFLKEELFTVIRRFWAGSQSLTSRYGSEVAAVVRMCQHALPMPAQSPLLKQDWTNLRQSLVDRYGEGGRKATRLLGDDVHRPRIGLQGWPFDSFPAGEVNVGLRVIYRQEWRHLGATRGEVVHTDPPALTEDETWATERTPRRTVETTFAQGDVTTSLDEIVNDAVDATLDAMKWSRDRDGSIAMGVHPLVATTGTGLESECRASSEDRCARLGDLMGRMAVETRDVTAVTVRLPVEHERDEASAHDRDGGDDHDPASRVYSRLQNRYAVQTRPVEIENVVLVAEKLPTPAEIDLAWVRRHAWILSRVLLDESFRDALATIGQEGRTPQRTRELDAKRAALHEHLRANVLHYQRAIWEQEDPQQRRMRYRRSGTAVPLDWRFELESESGMTIDELASRLTAPQVDGQFAAYSGGREMDLEQLIDLSGPIGYYGNYAIYHMRPELGDADLFSMLHFFKSPYLRPSRETGQPEVADPLEIASAEDPGIAASDRVRHVAIDADGLVIDVIRAVEPEPEEVEPLEDEIDAGDAGESHGLIVASGFTTESLSAGSCRVVNGEWVVAARDPGHATRLLAGARARDAGEQCVVAGGDGALTLGYAAAAAALQPREPAILASGDVGRATRLVAGAPSLRFAEPPILAARGEVPVPRVRGGLAHDAANEGVILAPDAGRSRITARPAPGRSDGAAIVAPDAGVRTQGLRAGAHDPARQLWERVILTRDEARLRLVSVVDTGTVHVRARRILARDHDRLRPSLFAR